MTVEITKAKRQTKPDFHLFGAFTKAEEQDDGSLIVEGLASSESRDSDGEIILASAIKQAIPDYMKWGAVREMHGNTAAGTALEIDVDDESKETRFKAQIFDPVSVMKIKKGVLKGFSVGGRKIEYNPKDRSVITSIKLSEVSVVDRPANPDCRFQIAKFEDMSKDMGSVATLASLIQQIGWLCAGAQMESDYEGDQSGVPEKLRQWLSLGVEVFEEMSEEETQELLADVAGPLGMPLRGADDKAAKAFMAALKKSKAFQPNGPTAVSPKEADSMAGELLKSVKDDVSKTWKDVEESHKAHKDAAAAVHGLKDDASKDDCSKAMKDLADAHKAHKDACDAHKDACHKAIMAMGGSKDDSSKDDSEKFAKLESRVAELTGLVKALASRPAPSPLELAIEQGKEGALGKAAGGNLPDLDPADPLYIMKKAARAGVPL